MLFKLMILTLYNPFFQNQKYHLLELTLDGEMSSSASSNSDPSGTIRIHEAIAKQLAVVVAAHHYGGKAELWATEPRPDSGEPDLNAGWSKVQAVINNYNGAEYALYSKNCRTFVNDVCEACDAKIRCSILNL